MKKLKVITIVGTRPEVIRLSTLIPKLNVLTDHILVHTGQNYDPQLNQVFFRDLKLRLPDYYMNVTTSSFGTVMADTIAKSEEIFQQEKPDAVMILGDTNSSVAALVAERMQIPVYHMEAGNRSFDNNVPEELNRKMVDHVATFNLPYSEHARLNLLAEGLSPRFIHKTGSPMNEVITEALKRVDNAATLARFGLASRRFLLLSLHRQENVDNIGKLKSSLSALNAVSSEAKLQVIVSSHPRLRDRLSNLDLSQFPNLRFHDPFGYLDYLALQVNAACVISDSGSVSEESAILGFKAISVRNTHERPESLGNPNCIVCPPVEASLRRTLGLLLSQETESRIPDDYLTLDFSNSVLAYLFSTVESFRFLKGLEPKEEVSE